MFSSVEYIREICKQRNIPISTLESECGFANGYLNPKKLKKLPYDRAVKIGEYLGISVEFLLTGEEAKKAPAPEGERSVSDDDIKFALFGGDGDITDEMYDEVKRFARMVKLREEAEKKKERP
ncbi:helix-turn-helix transcriptional regulator [Flavonifractor sp. An112]|mgnify:CR=1 FL=1|uniref:helix-turn-helix transcriptional regulator n=1 Tax=Flavonifractor sp. An112 TaxID=1965544 RepID=UPI0017482D8D|nr:helix-turn-helix transcriptional regulator [Flavonifractor sp. An112]